MAFGCSSCDRHPQTSRFVLLNWTRAAKAPGVAFLDSEYPRNCLHLTNVLDHPSTPGPENGRPLPSHACKELCSARYRCRGIARSTGRQHFNQAVKRRQNRWPAFGLPSLWSSEEAVYSKRVLEVDPENNQPTRMPPPQSIREGCWRSPHAAGQQDSNGERILERSR